MKYLIGASLVAMLNLTPSFIIADDYSRGDITVESPWVRTTIPNRPAAGYMTVRNSGNSADAILSASSPVADKVELHTHLMENGVMKMRAVEKVAIPAKGSAEFKSGGLHLMIFGVKTPLKDGDDLPLTVVFEKAGPVELDFKVSTLAGSKKVKDDHSGHGAHKH
ncbi:MAG: copper chaperone PCu(A)C [Hyphomicrobiaceae bacterium]|nr:copper chaperone PCu(A)C [Hyphomicrobiaceae bacterium]